VFFLDFSLYRTYQASAITSELRVSREELADQVPQCGATPSTINMRLFAALCLIGLTAA